MEAVIGLGIMWLYGVVIAVVGRDHGGHPSRDWRAAGNLCLAIWAGVMVVSAIGFWMTR